VQTPSERPEGASDPTPAEVVAFLGSPAAHGGAPVDVRETSMSWVFLTPERAYKLKKPIRRPPLDFSTLARRHRSCAEEVRLNARLAPETYLGLVPIRFGRHGLALGGPGRVVDWLVEMVRLADDAMLSSRIVAGDAREADALAVADRLAAFYAGLPREPEAGPTYLDRLRRELALDARVLLRPDFGLPEAASCLRSAVASLDRLAPLVLERARAGLVVEGHGDLRPEHVNLSPPIQIIDCLEFDRALRLLDAYEEVGYLGLECAQLGADWIGPIMLGRLAERLGAPPPPALQACYTLLRALNRARLCLAHLLETPVRTPERWHPLARAYLAAAEAARLSLRDP
jgi:uncharacterized protein